MSDLIELLFVEDEHDIKYIVELALSCDEGISITSFGSGREALSSLQESFKIFDFALLNMRLPEMTGVELHRSLRNLVGLRNLRTALITASLTRIDRCHFEAEGIVDVIEKPFDPLTLAATIRRLATSTSSQR